MTPRITAFYAGLSALLLVFLSVRVMLYRRSARIGLGDAGDKTLIRLMRAHGNAVENVLIGLLLLLVLELLAIAPLWLHLFGASLVLGRILHAWGVSRSAGKTFGRLWGMVLTWLAIIVMAVIALWQSVLWWLTSV
jgi:uncharacterized membrane protein YecN with MAPEG domain